MARSGGAPQRMHRPFTRGTELTRSTIERLRLLALLVAGAALLGGLDSLEQACRETGHAFVASGAYLERAALPGELVAIGLGTRRLRGKAEDLALFALERRPAAS